MWSLIGRFLFDEACCGFFADAADVAHFVLESDTVELVSTLQQFRTEGGGDELSSLRQTMDHGCSIGNRQARVMYTCSELPLIWTLK